MENIKKTYITNMPDKAGAFLQASKIIANCGGNIVRVNYNKALDVHTLFIDVDATEIQHRRINQLLTNYGYLLPTTKEETKVIMISIKIPDVVGAVIPILQIIDNYDINVTYINSKENGTGYQNLQMGLLIEKPNLIKRLLDEISQICEVRIVDYNFTEKNLDNTVFYIQFANEMREILGLNQQQTNEVTIQTNKIMQLLDQRNEVLPLKTFDYIKQFAQFVVDQKGDKFERDIHMQEFPNGTVIYLFQPPCGSNTYIIKNGKELLFVDCGFACYKNEMMKVFYDIVPNFNLCDKRALITHADIDHVGLLDLFDQTYMSEGCYQNFLLELRRQPNYREQVVLHEPYCIISKIISEYHTPNLKKCVVFDKKSDDELLTKIADFSYAGLDFEVFEGKGGHVKGETVFVCHQYKLIFTGDIFVNAKGFTEKQAYFNSLAPYLMRSVNVDSKVAREIRELICEKYQGYTVYPGHGTSIQI